MDALMDWLFLCFVAVLFVSGLMLMTSDRRDRLVVGVVFCWVVIVSAALGF